MHVPQGLPRIRLPNRDPHREAVGQRRTGRRQGDLELPFSDRLEDGLPPGQRDRLLLDDADALSPSLNEMPPSPGTGHVAHRTLAQSGGEQLVPRELACPQILYRERISEATRRDQFQPIFEHEQAYPRADDAVVPMHNGVHHRLEHGAITVLRYVEAGGILAGGDPPVSDDEAYRTANLVVERSADVLGVELPVPVLLASAVADGLNVCVRQPPPGILGC